MSRTCDDGSVTTFALIHGAWHGAWCFERLTPELEARGHQVIAVDLPGDDPTATFETYADHVLRALANEREELVLVGHSLGGMTIPLVAARRPVRRLIYLAAFVPVPGRSFAEQLADEPDTVLPDARAGLGERDEQGRSRWIDEAVAQRVLYADCDEHDAHAAFQRLRPQARAPYGVACGLERLPAAPSTYIVCAEDRILNPKRSRRVAHDRLGAEVVELPGSHSPALSRPSELAGVLHDHA
jgi:pimeloyl-ACP methyl ester carboxylesterase